MSMPGILAVLVSSGVVNNPLDHVKLLPTVVVAGGFMRPFGGGAGSVLVADNVRLFWLRALAVKCWSRESSIFVAWSNHAGLLVGNR